MNSEQISYLNSRHVPSDKASPLFKEYLKVKEKHKDKILLYGIGEFYETFFEDAILVSKLLEIVLTTKPAGELGKVPLAGIPKKSAAKFISTILEEGHKVALCDETDVAEGKVKREVIKIFTPGSLIDGEFLNGAVNNWLCAVCKNSQGYHFSYCDVSTGEFRASKGTREEILNEISRLNPSEILTPKEFLKDQDDIFREILKKYHVSEIEDVNFFWSEENSLTTNALLSYLKENLKEAFPRITKIENYAISDFVQIDDSTRLALEINFSMRSKAKFNTLLSHLDKTKTPMGKRLIKLWLNQPLKDISEIKNRQEAVKELVNSGKFEQFSKILEEVCDLSRIATKMNNTSANAKDFYTLKETVKNAINLNKFLEKYGSNLLNSIGDLCAELTDFVHILDKSIEENPPSSIKEGGIIKNGINSELDYYRNIIENSKTVEKQFEKKEKERTGIKSLKICFSKSFGHYIEIKHNEIKLVPSDYIRRQTLSTTERYTTKELKDHENEVYVAMGKSSQIEYKIFCDIREYAKEFMPKIALLAQKIAVIDVLASFAQCAAEYNYCCPKVDERYVLKINEGRHPVVERNINNFITNDTNLEKSDFILLTGPNMGGKSTYIRQNALIVLMAQAGSYVSAKTAQIGIVNKIFVRAGTFDNISRGMSSFMSEMLECAYILKSADDKSLVILDEIGCATSSRDGEALAQSICKYIVENIKCRTLFATHFHRLTELESVYPKIQNYKTDVANIAGKLEFVRKILKGFVKDSYGIEMAAAAGLPPEIIKNARLLIAQADKA